MNQPKEQVEVPEAAVEILAAELYEVYVANPAPDGWAGENDGAKGVWREESRQYLTAALPAIEQAVEERVRERVLRDGAVDRFGTNAVAAVKTARALHAEPEKFLSDHEAEALADYEAEALEAALIKYLEAEFSQPSTDSQGEGR